MAYYADIYVIKKTRSKALVLDFLDKFLPNRKETQNEYFILKNSENPIHCFEDVIDLMQYLEVNNKYRHSIYWKNSDKENPNKFGMVFYTLDGYIIFGISRDNRDFLDRQNEEECLNLMLNFLNTKEGYITYEQPPEVNYEKFKKMINQYNS